MSGERMYRQVSRRLMRDIVAEQWPVGSQLPTEKALSTRYAAGRGTMGGTLTVLKVMGLVELFTGTGARLVRLPDPAEPTDPGHSARGRDEARLLFEGDAAAYAKGAGKDLPTEADWWQEHRRKTGDCCVLTTSCGGTLKTRLDPGHPGIRIGRKVMTSGSHLCAENHCQRCRPAARHAEMIDTPDQPYSAWLEPVETVGRAICRLRRPCNPMTMDVPHANGPIRPQSVGRL